MTNPTQIAKLNGMTLQEYANMVTRNFLEVAKMQLEDSGANEMFLNHDGVAVVVARSEG